MAKFQQFCDFLRQAGMNFSGIFHKDRLENVLKKLDTKFGWPMMTGTSSNCVSPALEFSLEKLFLGKKQQFYGDYKFQTNLNFETR